MLIDAFIFPEQSSAFMKCNIIIIKNAHLLKLNVVNEFGKKLQWRVKKIIFAVTNNNDNNNNNNDNNNNNNNNNNNLHLLVLTQLLKRKYWTIKK